MNDVSPVDDFQRGPHVVVGDQKPEPLGFQLAQNVLNIVDRQRIYSDKRFVQQEVAGVGH